MPFSFPIGINLLTYPIPSPPDRRDLLDWQNGNTIDGSRFINPITLDYQITDNGYFSGMNPIQQEVYLAILTKYNSSSLPNFGNNITSIKLITPNFKSQAYNLINQALQTLITSGQISLTPPVNIQEPAPGQILIQFTWRDNVSGLTYQTNLPLNSQ